MKTATEQNNTCTHCNTDMQIKHIGHENLDINTQSLLVMFRIHEYKVAECPDCRHRKLCA